MTYTANKRIAAVHVGSPWRGMLPLPDGTLDANDRATLAYLYASFGIVSTIEASFAGAGSLSSLALNTKTGAATFIGAAALSALARRNAQAVASFAGSGQKSVLASKFSNAAATMAGAGALSTYANLSGLVSAQFAGSGAFSSLVLNTKTGATTFTGKGILSGGIETWKLAEALLAGVSDLALLGNFNAMMVTVFDGAGNLSADSAKSKFIEAVFSGAGSESIYANLNAAIIEVIFDGIGWMDTDVRKPGYLWPDADIDLDGWTDELDGTTNIFNSIDEADFDDNDYVQSPSTEAASNDLKVRLFEGAVQIAEWTHTDISATFQNATQVLTQGQFEAITDFGNLFVELDDNLGNVYRFSLSDPATGVNEPVAVSYRYKKLVA